MTFKSRANSRATSNTADCLEGTFLSLRLASREFSQTKRGNFQAKSRRGSYSISVREEIRGLRSSIPARICTHTLPSLCPFSRRCSPRRRIFIHCRPSAAASPLAFPIGAAERISFTCITAITVREKNCKPPRLAGRGGGRGEYCLPRVRADVYGADARQRDDGVIALRTFKGRPDSVAIKMHIDPTRGPSPSPLLAAGPWYLV